MTDNQESTPKVDEKKISDLISDASSEYVRTEVFERYKPDESTVNEIRWAFRRGAELGLKLEKPIPPSPTTPFIVLGSKEQDLVDIIKCRLEGFMENDEQGGSFFDEEKIELRPEEFDVMLWEMLELVTNLWCDLRDPDARRLTLSTETETFNIATCQEKFGFIHVSPDHYESMKTDGDGWKSQWKCAAADRDKAEAKVKELQARIDAQNSRLQCADCGSLLARF